MPFTKDGKYYEDTPIGPNTYREVNGQIDYNNIKPLPAGAVTVPRGASIDFGNGPSSPSSALDPSRSYRDPSLLASREKSLVSSLTDIGDAPSLEEITAEKQKAAEAAASGVRATYGRKIDEELAAGAARSARGRALNVGAGLIGSDFATANASEIDTKNQRLVDSIRTEMEDKVNQILYDVKARAQAQYDTERAAYRQDAEAALGKIKEIRDSAKVDVANLAKSGVSLSKLKAQSEIYKQLKEQTGLDDLSFDTLFAASIPAAQVLDKFVAGDKYIMITKSVDGTIQRQEITLPPEAIKPDYQFAIAPDGTPLVYNKNTGKAEIASGFREGQFLRPTAPSSSDKSDAKHKEDYAKAQKFITDNPGASQADLEREIRANTTELDEGDIKSLLRGTNKFLNEDYFRGIFTEKQLKEAAAAAGFQTAGGIFGFGKEGDTTKYLSHLMSVVEQYRNAGKTDDEILSLFPRK